MKRTLKNAHAGSDRNGTHTKPLRRHEKASRKTYWVVDVDIKGYFDHINHDKLMKLVEQCTSDKCVLKLIRKWLRAGVMENAQLHDTEMDMPQGDVISLL